MKIAFWLLLATVMFAGVVHAAGPFTVNAVNDTHDASPGGGTAHDSTGHITLRSAIEEANADAGATTINLPAGTYNLSLGDLVPGQAANTTIYVHGTGTAANTTIHQTQSGLMLFAINENVVSDVVFIMDNVTLTGGSENENDPDGFGGNGGAILAGGSTTAPGNVLSLTNVVFNGDYCSPVSNAGASGGAIDMSGGGNLNLYNCTFIGDQASEFSGTGYGGAIYFDAGFAGGNVVIRNSTFSGNIAHAAQGGAIYLAGGSGNTYTLTGDTFTNNSAGTQGGAIFLATGNLTANYDLFDRDSAATASGIYMSTGTSPAVSADMRNDWWGANGGPAGTGADTSFPTTSSSGPPAEDQITFNPSLQLDTSAGKNPILVNGSVTITASFLTNSAGQTVLASQIPEFNGLPVTWANALDGNPSAEQTTIQANGTATATFTATAPGTGKLEAEVDNVQNGDSSATASLTIYQSPAITSASNTTFTVGTSGSFTVTDTGSPTPDLSVAGTLPSVVSFKSASGVLSGIPGAGTGGTYPLVITAVNLGGTNTQSFTLNVDQPAAITSVNHATFAVGSSGSFTVTATGFPAPNLSVAGTLPTGVTFNSGTGVLSGNPAAGTGGIYPVTFTAHNGVGADGSQGFTLTVNEAPGINCQEDISTNSPGGICSPSVSFAASAGGFPMPVINYQFGGGAIVSPAAFPLGTNLVTVTATNSAGTNTCSFTVTVLKGPLPVMTIKPFQYVFAYYLTNKQGQVLAVSNFVSAQMSWPAGASCFLLQSSTNSLAGWTTIPTGPSNTLNVPFDSSKTAVFYRLIAP